MLAETGDGQNAQPLSPLDVQQTTTRASTRFTIDSILETNHSVSGKTSERGICKESVSEVLLGTPASFPRITNPTKDQCERTAAIGRQSPDNMDLVSVAERASPSSRQVIKHPSPSSSSSSSSSTTLATDVDYRPMTSSPPSQIPDMEISAGVIAGSDDIVRRGTQCSSLLARAAEAFHRRHNHQRLHQQQVAELRAFSDMLLAQMQYQYQNHYHQHVQHAQQQQQQRWKTQIGMIGRQFNQSLSQPYARQHQNHRNDVRSTVHCSGHFRPDGLHQRHHEFPDAPSADEFAESRKSADSQLTLSEVKSPTVNSLAVSRQKERDESGSSERKIQIDTKDILEHQFSGTQSSVSPQQQRRSCQQPTSTTVSNDDLNDNDDGKAYGRHDGNDQISVDDEDDELNYYTQDDDDDDGVIDDRTFHGENNIMFFSG